MNDTYELDDDNLKIIRGIIHHAIQQCAETLIEQINLDEGDYIIGFRLKKTSEGEVAMTQAKLVKENPRSEHGDN